MAQPEVTLDPVAIKQLQDRLAGFTDTRALMTRIGRVMKSDTQMNFRQGTSPTGAKWAPLKTREGQPLRLTGRLQRSIDYDAGDDEVVIGTNVKYAAFHQFGGGRIAAHRRLMTHAWGKKLKFPVWASVPAHDSGVPARPFIGLAARQLKKINASIDKWAATK